MAQKLAVVLMNLGCPLQKEDIEPFLYNFFMDENILSVPVFMRKILAGRIAKKRSKGAALNAYKELDYKSPLLENTIDQAVALQDIIMDNDVHGFDKVKVFVSMRYWPPTSEDTIEQVKDFGADHVLLLPLYPQFSTATTKSSLEDWVVKAKEMDLTCDITPICCYPFDDGFIKASADRIETAYNSAKRRRPDQKYRVLFSAHGLPEKTVKAGDPYQWQCEQSAKKIAAELQIEDLDWEVCYQSRVGPLKWIGPSTEEALQRAADDEKAVLIYPHAFVSEHVETLVEIEQEYKKLSKEMGVPDFVRVETVGTHPIFIQGLADIVKYTMYQRPQPALYCGHSRVSICPKQYKKCAFKILENVS